MYYVYDLQAIGQPTGPVKIGYGKNVIARLKALEPGAFGERLQVIFQMLAGATKAEGKKLESAYHFEFALLRINREQFRFDPRMLTWTPADVRRIYGETRTPATNTIPAVALAAGDISIFQPTPIQHERHVQKLPDSGDLTAAKSVQKIVQRVASPPRALLHTSARRVASQLNSTL